MSKRIFKKLSIFCLVLMTFLSVSAIALAKESGRIRVNFPGRGGWSAPTAGIIKTDRNNAFMQNLETPVAFKIYGMMYSKKHSLRVSKSTYGLDSVPTYKTWMPYNGNWYDESISARVGSAWWDLNAGHAFINYEP